jgi:glucan phosphoethanolaminetransferase (alkaline phosphatase superfamily)
MLYTIIGIFAIAAILGMTLLSFVLKGKETPRAIMILHGLFAATGLVLLLSYVFNNTPGPMESAVLFVIAALGGFVLVFRDLTGKPIPKWLAVVHGLIAVGGFIMLLAFAF